MSAVYALPLGIFKRTLATFGNRWPIVLIGFGFALTLVWSGTLVWLALQILGVF